MVYVVNSKSSNVTVIDGTSNATTPVDVGTSAFALAVNPTTNKIYVAIGGPGVFNIIIIVDGATNTATAALDQNAINLNALALNPVTNKVYVANYTSSNVTMLTEQQVQPVPLTTTITSPSGNELIAGTTGVFNFTTNSSYSPLAPAVQSVYYQFDTWQGPWLKATGGAPNFSGTAPPLSLGMHVIYAYAADGQFADSMQTGAGGNRQSSPIPGAIAAYVFVVVPPVTVNSVSLTNGADPSADGQTLVFTATVSSPGGAPTGTVVFYDFFQNTFQNTQYSTATAPLNKGSASWSPALPIGVNNIVAVYSGDSTFGPSSSSPWTQYVMSNGTNGTNRTANLSVTPEVFFRQRALFSVQVTATGAGTGPFGTVVLVGDENLQFGPFLTLDSSGNGTATYSTLLRPGTYKVHAIYLGDSNYAGISTSTQTVSVSPRPFIAKKVP
jgi:hypothetical protein